MTKSTYNNLNELQQANNENIEKAGKSVGNCAMATTLFTGVAITWALADTPIVAGITGAFAILTGLATISKIQEKSTLTQANVAIEIAKIQELEQHTL